MVIKCLEINLSFIQVSNDKNRRDFIEYIDGLIERTTLNKSVHKIMQRENDLYESQEELIDDKHVDSCRQVITRITNTSKKGKMVDFSNEIKYWLTWMIFSYI
jgi:hypothetical protein